MTLQYRPTDVVIEFRCGFVDSHSTICRQGRRKLGQSPSDVGDCGLLHHGLHERYFAAVACPAKKTFELSAVAILLSQSVRSRCDPKMA